jgi:hypothetical protein
MTEEEYQQKSREFIAQLEHWPKVGKRPFGYPKSQWFLQTVWITLGFLLLIPIAVGEQFTRGSVLAAISGSALIGFAFTMRPVVCGSRWADCFIKRPSASGSSSIAAGETSNT